MHDVIYNYKAGLEVAVQAITEMWDLRIVFEGSKAYSEGRTIYLPNVELFSVKKEITKEDVETARALFTALRGFAWGEAGRFVESEPVPEAWRGAHGSFALALQSILDDIRIEHRFSKRGPGIAQAIEFTREMWVWPRYVELRKKNPPNIIKEVLYGLQITLKHYEARYAHEVWKALTPEATSFVERCMDALDSAYDTLKMEKGPATRRLCEVAERLIEQWKAEFSAIAPLAKTLKPRTRVPVAPNDKHEFEAPCAEAEAEDSHVDTDIHQEGVDAVAALDGLELNEGIPPFILATIAPRAQGLHNIPFGSGYVKRVEWLPWTADGWDKLEPLQAGETRTLVLCPPDPEKERKLDEMMAGLLRALASIGNEIRDQMETAIQQAKVELDKTPSDQQQYLVWTSKYDRFTAPALASRQQLQSLRNVVERHYGVIKTRLQTLLRARTQTRWRGNMEEGSQLDQGAIASIAMGVSMPQATLRPFRVRNVDSDLMDTSVGLLTDRSGSMAGSKLEIAKQAMLCFAECLDLAKIPFAAWTFSSNCSSSYYESRDLPETEQQLYGRLGGLDIQTIKSFSETWMQVAQRLPSVQANEANYDADSVHWASMQLLRQKTRRRVLFVLSDGLPASGDPPMQQARQRKHLGDIVKAMTAQKIEVVGIGICDRSVEKFYPNHVVVNRADDLPKVVMSQMQFLLLNASSNRR